MHTNPQTKYRPHITPPSLPDRQWPNRRIETAPRWLSTDLRDGNQALIDPMSIEKKRTFFDMLTRIGFKEIEVAFPSASQIEFDFVRHLIETDAIAEDVWVQVLTPARSERIARTFESLNGVKRACVHLYNATAPLFRQMVLRMSAEETLSLALTGACSMMVEREKYPHTDWRFEYSPEFFNFTEPEFALEVCERVLDIWQPTAECPVILNLPETVEAATPNVYADQIEWFCRHISRRDAVVISVHTHNDRGTGIAAAELAMLAGAERVEGCLFGNGERTGNVDLATLALNLYSQGIDPGLDFSDMRTVVRTVEACNGLTVPPRHPYAGELVFTAFSGTHQDAIKKGMAARNQAPNGVWNVPYLCVDPADLGKTYEAVIRINSQSGKGGVAWVLEREMGVQLPRRVQIEFSAIVQDMADARGSALSAQDICRAFEDTYAPYGTGPLSLLRFSPHYSETANHVVTATVRHGDREIALRGQGNGLISAAIDAVQTAFGGTIDVIDLRQHALSRGTDARAVTFLECRVGERTWHGVGIDADVATASVKAVLSVVARLYPGQ